MVFVSMRRNFSCCAVVEVDYFSSLVGLLSLKFGMKVINKVNFLFVLPAVASESGSFVGKIKRELESKAMFEVLAPHMKIMSTTEETQRKRTGTDVFFISEVSATECGGSPYTSSGVYFGDSTCLDVTVPQSDDIGKL